MRRTISLFSVIFLSFSNILPGIAQTTEASREATDGPVDQSLLAHTIADLLARAVTPGGDPMQRKWLDQLISFYAALGAEVLWVDRSGWSPRALAAIREIARADDYALDPTRFDLPDPALPIVGPAALAAAEVRLSLTVATYAWHARGGRLQPTELSLWLDYAPRPPNIADVLKTLADSPDVALGLRALHPQDAAFEALRQAYLKARDGQAIATSAPEPGEGSRKKGSRSNRAATGNREMIDLIRVNMERRRWLPRELGPLYIWNNLPEFETRVVKDGEIIHRERIIIGETSTQTPVFSDQMVRVIYRPDWTVPESIKLSSIWNNLRGGDYGVLKRRNMRIIVDGKEINPAKLKYAELNARDVPIVMGPGPGNPLGQFKFVFPNKHDVYMHDTTSKGLFDSKTRTFSHGCIRVRNPERFAEVILAEGKGWNKADLRWQMRAKTTTRLELDRQIPVHNTYFTLVADASGSLTRLPDIYGHDKRMIDAFNGVATSKIAANDPALALKKKNEDLASGAVVPPLLQGQIISGKPRRFAVAAPQPYASGFFKPAPAPRPYSAPRQAVQRIEPRPQCRGFFCY